MDINALEKEESHVLETGQCQEIRSRHPAGVVELIQLASNSSIRYQQKYELVLVFKTEKH